ENDGYEGMDLFQPRNNRMIYMETGVQMRLPKVGEDHIISEDDFSNLATSYYTSESGLLTMSEDFYDEQVKSKQIGVMDRDYFLIKEPLTPEAPYIFIDKHSRQHQQLNESLLLKSKTNAASLLYALKCYENKKMNEC
ncbi:MAG: hypothetical protein P1U57_14400, partial [Oleibacter sp.]|nr:hypothetical protein [Thalassolituus sp.]